MGPLLLSVNKDNDGPSKDEPLVCILCDDEFIDDEKPQKDALLKHLLTIHKLVIADVHLIANLGRYDLVIYL